MLTPRMKKVRQPGKDWDRWWWSRDWIQIHPRPWTDHCSWVTDATDSSRSVTVHKRLNEQASNWCNHELPSCTLQPFPLVIYQPSLACKAWTVLDLFLVLWVRWFRKLFSHSVHLKLGWGRQVTRLLLQVYQQNNKCLIVTNQYIWEAISDKLETQR